jgi:hypothetical protein
MSDTERLDWLEKQRGNLFTPDNTGGDGWVWFGNDARNFRGATCRQLIDAAISQSSGDSST